MRLSSVNPQLTIYHVLLKLVPPRGHHFLYLCLRDLLCLGLRCIVCTQVDGFAESINTDKKYKQLRKGMNNIIKRNYVATT